jgi:hypothetical protein
MAGKMKMGKMGKNPNDLPLSILGCFSNFILLFHPNISTVF